MRNEKADSSENLRGAGEGRTPTRSGDSSKSPWKILRGQWKISPLFDVITRGGTAEPAVAPCDRVLNLLPFCRLRWKTVHSVKVKLAWVIRSVGGGGVLTATEEGC